MLTDRISRRTMLQLVSAASVAAVASVASNTCSAQDAPPPQPKYRIGVCDWMILKRQRLGAIALSKEIGVDGVELDMGSLGDRDTFENALAKTDVRQKFQEEAAKHNIQFCSLAMSGFYAQSFAQRPTYRRMLSDCITTMTQLGIGTAFLPLGIQNDLVQYPELRPAVVSRLREVGTMAADAGVVIGIETALDAAREVELLEDIGSDGIRSYFNFANALQNGRDLSEQLQILGKRWICQIHCTDEDGVWLEHNQRLDMPSVKQTLDAMDWQGWLVMERSRDANNARDVRGNYGANARYLKSIFQ
jgi:L-ribulose-5-phosphate 3-epimerase